jgi:hypothetical protein
MTWPDAVALGDRLGYTKTASWIESDYGCRARALACGRSWPRIASRQAAAQASCSPAEVRPRCRWVAPAVCVHL